MAMVACLAGAFVFSGCGQSEEDNPNENGNTEGKPTAVMNFIATAGDRQVSLTWDKPSDNGGSEITGYEVTMDNWAKKVTKTASETSHTYTGLTNDKEYTFKVRAVNANGAGMESAKNATPTADGGGGRTLTADEKELVGKYSYGSSGSGYWAYYSYDYDQWKDAYSFAQGIHFKSDGTYESFQFAHGKAFIRGGSLIKTTAKWKISTKGTVTFSDYVNNIKYADGTTAVQNMSDKTQYPNWNPNEPYSFEEKEGKKGIRWWNNFFEKEE